MNPETRGKLVAGLVAPVLIVAVASGGDLHLAWQPKVAFTCLIGLLATLSQPAYHPLRSRPGDRGTALQILWTVMITQLVALVEAFHLNWPDSMALDARFAIAAAVGIGGLVLRASAWRALGASFTWFVHVEPGQAIVRSGPYARLAHPSYTGALMTYVAIPVMFGSWFAAALAAIALPAAFVRRIRLEERALVASLGPPYAEYVAGRDRLVPFVW